MSKECSADGLFVDTGLLRDHVSKLRCQRKTATRLYETVKEMQRSCMDPTEASQYEPVLRNIRKLEDYLYKLVDVLECADDDATQLSYQLGVIIHDDAQWVHTVASSTLML